MEVTFSEGGRYKFACYRLTYGESKSPDRIAKIKADLASKGKDGYSIAITYDASDNILDFVSVDEYRKMEDELKKAYQYFEWNDRSGAYRYYEEIQKKVAAQVKDWKAINPRAEITSVRIMLFST